MRILRILCGILLFCLLFAAGGIALLTVLEFRPADREDIQVRESSSAGKELSSGDSFRIATWNIGYGALGDNADFFMDGGTMVNTADKARAEENLTGIADILSDIDADILFLQEIDTDSTRSHHIDQPAHLMADQRIRACSTGSSAFAYNFRTAFVPYPIPPIGKVDSGILTASVYPISQATRIQLPCPFKWPIRIANLKRCLLVSRLPIKDSDKELVLINLHLEAYDNGEGKIAQAAMMTDLLREEAATGNYIIAGGDFNQTFTSVDRSGYPEFPDKWHCGTYDVSSLTSGFSFEMDNRIPSCRSLDQPYSDAPDKDPAHFQYYLIDGFIVSENLTVSSVETQDDHFRYADHNPVVMEVTIP